MLTVHNLSKSYILHTLFQNVTFSVNAADRIGLIGPNGSGKSTLLKIIVGVEQPTSGTIHRPRDLQIGYLAQGADFDPTRTVTDIIQEASGDMAFLEGEFAMAATALAEKPDDPAVQQLYDTLLVRISRFDVGRVQQIMDELGLSEIDQSLPAGLLSGGQKTRLSLALILIDGPDLLLLDEPTNHLDIDMLEWLEEWLSRFPGGALIVSHDRVFLDRTVNRILDFDPHQKTLVDYPGNYSDYLDQFQADRDRQWSAWKDQQAEVRRMKRDIARTREQSDKVHRQTTPRNPSVRRLAKKVMKKALSREKKLDRYLESDERVDKPQRSWQMKVDFAESETLGRTVVEITDLTVGYSADKPLLSTGDLQVQSGQRIVIAGPNGSGKTTFLRTLAGQLTPLAGRFTVGSTVQMGFMTQEQELLDMGLSPFETLERLGYGTETEIRSYLHYYLFKDDEPLKPNHMLSFGQRARLSLAVMVAQGCNLLLLDEPINHLDIPSRTQFEQALFQFPGTILAVVHDRFFIDRVSTNIWWVEDGRIVEEITNDQ